MMRDFSSFYQANPQRSGARRSIPISRDRHRYPDIFVSNTNVSDNLPRNWDFFFEHLAPVYRKGPSLYYYYERPEIRQQAPSENLSQALRGEALTVNLTNLRELADVFTLRQRLVVGGFTVPVDLVSRQVASCTQGPARSVMERPVGATTLPVVVLEKAKMLLGENNVQEAVCVLRSGVEQFPDDLRIADLLRIISPQGRPRKVNMVIKSCQEETSWIKTHGRKYRGKWIALDGSELVSFSDTLRQLLENVDRKSEEEGMPLIQYVESGAG